MSKKDHEHLYHKILYGKNKRIVYGCKVCSTFIQPAFLIGRLVICNDCLEKFEIRNKKDLTKLIRCRKCRKRPEIVTDKDALQVVKELMGEK